MLKANYHTHTVLCDGKNTAEEMVQRALDLGFKYLGFSGHMDPGVHMDWPTYVAEVRRLQGLYGERLDILMGVDILSRFIHTAFPKRLQENKRFFG